MKNMNKFLLGAVLAVGMALNANALLLTPADADWQGSTPKNPNADAIESITGTSAQLTTLYKNDVGGVDSGSLAGSYDTTYFNTPTDPEDAKIEYKGGPIVSGSPIYLLVKDGNNDPIWYIFDITGWNGTETIELENFWPNQGAISHVSIYGTGTTNVPDAGSSVALLGLALTSVSLLRRKLQAK
jgi:hypothetical protein